MSNRYRFSVPEATPRPVDRCSQRSASGFTLSEPWIVNLLNTAGVGREIATEARAPRIKWRDDLRSRAIGNGAATH